MTLPLFKTATVFYALPIPYSQLMTSLLISLLFFKQLKRSFSSFHHHRLPPSHYMEWDELPVLLSEVKPPTVCWSPDSPIQGLPSQSCCHSLLFCLINFPPLLSFQSACEYAVIFSSPYPLKLRSLSGILQYYLHLPSTILYHDALSLEVYVFLNQLLKKFILNRLTNKEASKNCNISIPIHSDLLLFYLWYQNNNAAA